MDNKKIVELITMTQQSFDQFDKTVDGLSKKASTFNAKLKSKVDKWVYEGSLTLAEGANLLRKAASDPSVIFEHLDIPGYSVAYGKPTKNTKTASDTKLDAFQKFYRDTHHLTTRR